MPELALSDDDLQDFMRCLDNNADLVPPPFPILRAGAIPSHKTFSMRPVRVFVEKWLPPAPAIIIDPFARDCLYGTITNDLNPDTLAQRHVDARQFLDDLLVEGVTADAVLLDPPYSPRQISECYQGFGLKPTTKDTQVAALYKECKNKMTALLKPGGVALSFGWSSQGFSHRRGFTTLEILMVYHGAGRNDTICVAERLDRR